jgi:23S rRNA pseudouridine955/2504/2580 synthase
MIKQPVQIISITDNNLHQRVDNFLLTQLKNIPKTRIYRALRKGEVRVNKKRVGPDYRLQLGDQVRLPPLKRETQEKSGQPPAYDLERLKNNILFEDPKLMVINKPAGIAVHGGSGVPWGIIEILRTQLPKGHFLELVHRLDRDTSGCLLLAKKRSMLKELHQLLEKNTLEKTYWALVKGHWPKSLRKVDAPLFKNQPLSGERMVQVNTKGKDSLTLFKPLQYFKEATLIEAKPKTGRTHQIRVHAAYAGHPLAGDEKYGDYEFNKMIKKQGNRRLFLHATSVKFRLDELEKVYFFEAPLAEDLERVLRSLE